ncbi:MAG: rod shape determining protein RodA [Alphaproteobacteria bacterium]|nr:rod shape determining protein RodA [Alphaproteobacteria bacterium]
MALESAIGSANTTRASSSLTLGMKISRINWPLLVMLSLIACYGTAILYSAGRGWSPWAWMHLLRFGVGVVMMLVVALIDIRHWMRLAYPIYVLGLILLIWVEVAGDIGMGAQRWINLGFMQLQPSEIMKVALVLVYARYFHIINPGRISHPVSLLLPLALLVIPVALVMRQPDLGTALLLLAGSGGLMFLAGVSWIYFASAIAAVAAALPIAWGFLRDYQKNRVLTFLNPEADPLGTGYHIMQSKIAFGSGGVFGKGYMQGTQSHLDFLPEMQTDFIFTMLAEEMGMIGALVLLCLFGAVIAYGYIIAMRVRHQFGRLIVLGVILNFSVYVFINMSMVMGLIPVVGVPLPFVSYGGTAMLSLLFGFGLLLSASVHRGVPIPENTGMFL